jgi:hypothetical protein
MNRLLTVAFAALAVILLALYSCEREASLAISTNAQKALLDKERVIEMNARDLKRLSADNDTLLQRLQNLVSKRTQSATTATLVIRDTVRMPVFISAWDTLTVHDTVQMVLPQYSFHHRDRWSEIAGVAAHDGATLRYQIFTELDVVQEKKGGLFEKPYTVVRIQASNPHLQVLDQRSYHIQARKPHRLLWLGLGLAAGVAGGAYLSR